MNKELINIIENMPEEIYVPQERFTNISFSKVYHVYDRCSFEYWDNTLIDYEIRIYLTDNEFRVALFKKGSSVAFKRTHKFLQKVAENFKAYLEILGYQGYISLYDYE